MEYDSATGLYQYEANYDYYDRKLSADKFISIDVSNTPAALQAGDVDEVSSCNQTGNLTAECAEGRGGEING